MYVHLIWKKVNPHSICIASFNVGALWCSWMKSLFRSLGSRHIYMDPLAFLLWVRDDIYAVEVGSGMMIPICSIFWTLASNFSHSSIGTPLQPKWTDAVLGSTMIWCSPGMEVLVSRIHRR